MRRALPLCLLLCCQEVHAETTLVAAASNLTHAMTEINLAFEQEHGRKVALSFGSSGSFLWQLVFGAPYKIFISAGEPYINRLQRTRRWQTHSQVREFAHGRLSLHLPEASKIGHPATLNEALNALKYGAFRKMAIANPSHAPYGKAAEQALRNAGLWAVKRDKLLLGENAAQAMQFCLSGSVDACLVPSSFLKVKRFGARGASFPIPPAWHEPIVQYRALLDGENEASRLFFDYLSSPAAAAILQKYGYGLPH